MKAEAIKMGKQKELDSIDQSLLALDELFNEMTKSEMDVIVNSVLDMKLQGPTLSEYFHGFESQYFDLIQPNNKNQNSQSCQVELAYGEILAYTGFAFNQKDKIECEISPPIGKAIIIKNTAPNQNSEFFFV